MARTHTIDIGGLLAGGRQVLIVDDEVPIEPFEGIAFARPAIVHLELRVVDRILTVEGTIDARARGPCVSCLEDAALQVHVDVEERLDPVAGRDRDPFGDSNVLSGDRFDVEDLARQSVLSVLPMGLRCMQECRGLCGTCGANLNASACSCGNGESRGKPEVEDAAQ
ncbi:MAG: DUF177 domain-containing protein [Candidatus Eremiobacteraeota bacterium]|nr:DUF177 domain-containing protein [Candidatus Eremiobacteraeota bacterium]MBV8374131.1 DUF177 domain-containing protein [Candidatus Eremiobacteraeota bacterium]